MPNQTKEKINRLAARYFSFISDNYPVLSSSDEFYFFPLIARPDALTTNIETFDREKITEDIRKITEFECDVDQIKPGEGELEERIDVSILKASINSVKSEVSDVKCWERDPLLYLKIMMIYATEYLGRLPEEKKELKDMLVGRLKKIPVILAEAQENLSAVPGVHLQIGIEMSEECLHYFARTVRKTLEASYKRGAEIRKLNRECCESLNEFIKFLKGLPGSVGFAVGKERLNNILGNCFGSEKDVDEAYSICRAEFAEVGEAIEAAGGADWRDLLEKEKRRLRRVKNGLEVFQREVRSLEDFFKSKDVIPDFAADSVCVMETPDYLGPFRSTASYESVSRDKDGGNPKFFVSVYEKRGKFGWRKKIRRDVLLEAKFMAAHETWPGHHVLDSVRSALRNQIRRQFESPLFYEGWACYAESLLSEHGYVSNDKVQKIVGLKRRLWRAVRGMIDIDLHSRKISVADAEKKLVNIGYDPHLARLQARQYALSYGYQLCYSLGKFEMENLKDNFAAGLGLKKFHKLLLEGGEIPFKYVRKRLENA